MKKLSMNKIGKPRLLIIGCGDVGMRLLPLVRDPAGATGTRAMLKPMLDRLALWDR